MNNLEFLASIYNMLMYTAEQGLNVGWVAGALDDLMDLVVDRGGWRCCSFPQQGSCSQSS